MLKLEMSYETTVEVYEGYIRLTQEESVVLLSPSQAHQLVAALPKMIKTVVTEKLRSMDL
jgi:hypothetical protein